MPENSHRMASKVCTFFLYSEINEWEKTSFMTIMIKDIKNNWMFVRTSYTFISSYVFFIWCHSNLLITLRIGKLIAFVDPFPNPSNEKVLKCKSWNVHEPFNYLSYNEKMKLQKKYTVLCHIIYFTMHLLLYCNHAFCESRQDLLLSMHDKFILL